MTYMTDQQRRCKHDWRTLQNLSTGQQLTYCVKCKAISPKPDQKPRAKGSPNG